jgi:hypothetical protein
VLVVTALATTGALAATPTQVIDAQTDPQRAADALNSGCADLSNCKWQDDGKITVGYGPSRILGDVLYNCTDPADQDANDETAVGVTDERAETTSLSEKVSLKISLGFLGFEKTSAEFEAFSKQAETFETGVTTKSSIIVGPGEKGWTETQVLTASTTGDAYITAGINKLIQVKDIDLDFPGYADPNDSRGTVLYNQFEEPMTEDDLASRCGPVNRLSGATPRAYVGTFNITLCSADPDSRHLRCTPRAVTGNAPPTRAYATAELTRAGTTYASDTNLDGRVRLISRRAITAGNYTLTLHRRPIAAGKKRDRSVRTLTTVVPITIR